MCVYFYTMYPHVTYLFSEWAAQTSHTQALSPPQVQAYQAQCFSLIRLFSRDIQDSGNKNHLTKIILFVCILKYYFVLPVNRPFFE